MPENERAVCRVRSSEEALSITIVSRTAFLRAVAARDACNDFRRTARSLGRSLVHMGDGHGRQCRGERRCHLFPDCFREQGLTRLCEDPLADFRSVAGFSCLQANLARIPRACPSAA